jgi:hypothetical protein
LKEIMDTLTSNDNGLRNLEAHLTATYQACILWGTRG